tara:strand:+ start:24609 stop:26456 length:1848 start_codon:yes stop_codon:yes gene_type:complete
MDAELEHLVNAKKLDTETAEKVQALSPGAFCQHKSWGVGKIKSWDLVADRLLIDFEEKPNHAMKLKFAANALVPLPADHIMAQRLESTSELQELAEKDPVELVRRTLISHNNTMSLDELDAVLKGVIVPDGKYKNWWDKAKKELRQDRSFVVPSKRNLPLELRGADVSPSAAMIEDIISSPDLKSKAKNVEAILKDEKAFDNPVEELNPVVDDLNASALKCAKMMPGQALELILAREEVEAKFEGVDSGEDKLELAGFLVGERNQLGEILRGLGVARQRQVLESFPDAFGEEWPEVVMEMLSTAGLRGTSELTKFLVEKGKQTELNDFLRLGLQQRAHSSDLLAWICKERTGKAADVVDADLPSVLMAALEKDHFGEGVRRSNRLAETLQGDQDLIPDMITGLDINAVRGFARRLMMSPAFDELTRKSLLARIVKVHPEIQDLITGSKDAQTQKDEHLIVSFESLEAKQKEFDNLCNVLQPKNREEIKVAREYGDLRENFEYKAAKQQEAVLRRQREEMERDISRARGTDFSDVDTSFVSVGTIVEIEDEEAGKKETYTILGAWDSDPDNNIIAYTTGAGQSLIGKSVGDSASLPTEIPDHTRSVKIVSIKAYAS